MESQPVVSVMVAISLIIQYFLNIQKSSGMVYGYDFNPILRKAINNPVVPQNVFPNFLSVNFRNNPSHFRKSAYFFSGFEHVISK